VRHDYLLAIARYGSGDATGAHLDLIELDRREDCPTAARVLLALLELDRGESDRALETLRRNLARGADAMTCQAMVLMELTERLPDEATQAAGFLGHAFELDGFCSRWLKSLSLAGSADLPQAPSALSRQMGEALLSRQHVIPTLMLGQKHRPHRGRINQLREALSLIVQRLDDVEKGYGCLGELALLADDAEDARRWVRLGLSSFPYSAKLALLSDRIDSLLEPDEASVRLTLAALEQAIDAKPDYGDVRRALILRYRRQGLDAQAMRQAKRWVDRAPDHPMAQETLKEVAA
jgi:tetratricopeptide (TPR) repeat protein